MITFTPDIKFEEVMNFPCMRNTIRVLDRDIYMPVYFDPDCFVRLTHKPSWGGLIAFVAFYVARGGSAGRGLELEALHLAMAAEVDDMGGALQEYALEVVGGRAPAGFHDDTVAVR